MPRQAKRNSDMETPRFLHPNADGAGAGVRVRDDGPVTHLTAGSLERPLELPRREYRKLIPILLVAILVSVAALVAYNGTVINDMQRKQAQVGEEINRGVSLDLPKMDTYVGKTNEAMKETFKSQGYSMYDNSNDEDRNVDGFDMYKLAPDVDAQEAAEAYSQGLENLGAVQAARYLSGSWRFLVARGDNVELRLRYADFDAADAASAIQSALESQGFEDAKVSDAAEDTMGNTNLSGSFDKSKKTYEYTISACDLSQVYDIDGAPEGAQYVGIRITEKK